MQHPVFLLPVHTFRCEQGLNQTAFLYTDLKVQRFQQLLGPQDQAYLGLAHLVTDPGCGQLHNSQLPPGASTGSGAV